mgnify:CR=1 FL=1
MKKSMKLAGLLAMLMMVFVATTAFTGVNNVQSDDQSCKVTVYYSNGSVASGVEVQTEVSGGISCCGGRKYTTDSDGVAILYWVKGCNLKKVYVKGTGYSVDYKDGGSYKLTLE